MRERKPLLITATMTVVIGSIGLTHLMQQPRFQDFHNVDVFQLLASGACFGVALTSVCVFFGLGRFAAHQSKTD